MVRSVDGEDLEEVGFGSSVLHMLKLGYILDIRVEIVRGEVSVCTWSRGPSWRQSWRGQGLQRCLHSHAWVRHSGKELRHRRGPGTKPKIL